MSSEGADHLKGAATAAEVDACLYCHDGEPLPSGKRLNTLSVGPYELAQALEAATPDELLP